MLHDQLEDISESLLRELCTNACPESQTLDFKRELPGRSDRDRSEFLKDVCAFANADGGDLVYGLEEQDGHASAVSSITTESADAAQRRLGQILDAGIEPRVEGRVLHPVIFSDGTYALVLRIPFSFQRPHRYHVGNHTRWVVRAGTHTIDLTYDQIREGFDRTAALAKQSNRFRDERLARVLSGNTARPLRPGPLCVVHLIPIASIAGKASVDVRALYNGYQQFMFSDWGGATRSLNLDGLVVHPGAASTAYVQIFRSGALEAVKLASSSVSERKIIPSLTISAFIKDAITKFIAAARQWNVGGPAVASVAILTIDGYAFAYQGSGGIPEFKPADRTNLIIPELWIDRLDSLTTPDQIVHPLLDILFQSFDLERCVFYDENGRWSG